MRTRLIPMLLLAVAFAAAVHFNVLDPGAALMLGAIGQTAPFTVNPELTAIAIGYKNNEDDLIADRLMPRVDTADKFSWTEYGDAEAYTLADAKVGRKSEPSQISFSGTQKSDQVEDFGFDDPIPERDIKSWQDMPKPATGGPLDPRQIAAMMLTHHLGLAREVRVAAKVQDPANYLPNLQAVVAGGAYWTDEASNPLDVLLAALDEPLLRPNLLAISQPVWRVLRQHKKIVQAVNRNDQGAGTITKEQLASLLEIKKVEVGPSRINIARRGQAANIQRVWGNNAALLYVSEVAAQSFQPTWGFTAQWGTKIAGEIIEPKKGLLGSRTIRVGEMVKEVVAARGSGYLLRNVLGA